MGRGIKGADEMDEEAERALRGVAMPPAPVPGAVVVAVVASSAPLSSCEWRVALRPCVRRERDMDMDREKGLAGSAGCCPC